MDSHQGDEEKTEVAKENLRRFNKHLMNEIKRLKVTLFYS